VAANCGGNATAVVPGLGACLSELVSVPQVSGTSVLVPLPTITGLNTPAVTNNGSRRLAWWEILLMTLGCVLIFLCVLALFRRRMRGKRAKQTAEFAAAKNIDARGVGWRGRLGALFSRGRRIPKEEKVALRVARLRNLEEDRHMATLGKLGVLAPPRPSQYVRSVAGETGSLYSQVTGVPPRLPMARQPVLGARSVERSSESWRYSGTTISSSRSITDAQRYVKSVEDRDELDEGGSHGGYSGHPAGTGSRNPFRK
jgi:hypothetical protein